MLALRIQLLPEVEDNLRIGWNIKTVMSSGNCFIKRSEFITKTSLPQCLFFKKSNSTKMTILGHQIFIFLFLFLFKSVIYDNSSLTLIFHDSLHYLRLFDD